MIKKLLLMLTVAVAVGYAQPGLKISGNIVDGVDYGAGGGFFYQFNFNKYFSFYPGLDVWYASKEISSGIKHSVLEADFNLSFKGFVPIKEQFGPFVGVSIVPMVYASWWKPSTSKPSPSTDFAADAFIGFDFPITKSLSGLLEVRKKMASEYDALKFSLGIMF